LRIKYYILINSDKIDIYELVCTVECDAFDR